MPADPHRENGKLEAIHAMLHPRSIAIVGATDRLQYGGRFLNNLLTTGCKSRLYPVNPRRDEVLGIRCYHSIKELPESVDLAAIIIPASLAVSALRECAEIGAKSALVISAGFAELGTEEGRARQFELTRSARETGVRVCGPNCQGLVNVAEASWATATSRVSPETQSPCSPIGLVSQSGATCFGPLMAMARDRGVGFHYIVSSGNEADLVCSDYIEYMLRDPEVKVVAALVEGFRDGARFLRVAEMAVETDKPLVLLKVGRSAAGARAAGSHTAAMTGSDVVQEALFKQKGVVRVDDYDELIETANMFLKAKRPKGARVGVVSHSGGIGSFLADKLGERGLELPPLSDQTRDGLGRIMGERGSAANPADVTGFAHSDSFPEILKLLLEDKGLDIQIVASAARGSQAPTVLQAAEESDRPILYLWTGSTRDMGSLPQLQAGRVPMFYLPDKCAKGVRRLVDYCRTRNAILAEKESPFPSGEGPGEGLSYESALAALRTLTAVAGRQPISEYDSKKALSLFGVPTTREVLCTSLDDAVKAGAEIGYPVALKVVSEQITHKTEAGGVRLGIAGEEALVEAYERMLATVRARCPEARIGGVLVQRMVSGGVEVIVGISRDPQFGSVLMLGLGGVLVEALGAASWRVCPVNAREALEMIGEVKGLSRILAGYRGHPKADVEALVTTVVRLSHLAVGAEEMISSLDVNPLVVLPEGQGVVALDALIIPTC